MEFPCEFIIKIVGVNSDTFELDVISITRKHFPNVKSDSIKTTLSQQENYLSISIVLYIHDQLTLDSLYIDLTKHPDVKMVL